MSDTEKCVENFRNEKVEESKLTDEEKKMFDEILKETKLPVSLNEEKFTFGEGELNITKLSKPYRDQMLFRTLTLNTVYLRTLCQSMTDIIRIMMLMLEKGFSEVKAEDFVKEMEQLLTKLQ